MAKRVDVSVVNDGGSMVLLQPVTRRARQWFADNLPEDAPRMGNAYAVESNYHGAIVEGLKADGLTLRLS